MRDNRQLTLVQRCEELGYKVEITPGGHFKVYTPNGPVFMPSSASEKKHGWKKDRARLRRKGVAI